MDIRDGSIVVVGAEFALTLQLELDNASCGGPNGPMAKLLGIASAGGMGGSSASSALSPQGFAPFRGC